MSFCMRQGGLWRSIVLTFIRGMGRADLAAGRRAALVGAAAAPSLAAWAVAVPGFLPALHGLGRQVRFMLMAGFMAYVA
jgi:hypothetical protein